MKNSLLALLLVLFASELKAQRYDGVDPCAGPGIVRTMIDTALGVAVSTESSAGGGGGIVCAIAISSDAVDGTTGVNLLRDYVVCLDSRPTSAGVASTPGGLGIEIGYSTDTRIIYPALIAASAVVTGLPVSLKPVPFKNLFCDIQNARTKAIVYWVPSSR